MKRPIDELPVVEISHTHTYDPARITDGCRVDINVELQGDTAGNISLDDPSDLHILRDAIDRYIKTNNINPPEIDHLDNEN